MRACHYVDRSGRLACGRAGVLLSSRRPGSVDCADCRRTFGMRRRIAQFSPEDPSRIRTQKRWRPLKSPLNHADILHMNFTNEAALEAAKKTLVEIVRTLDGCAVRIVGGGDVVREFGRRAGAVEFCERHNLEVV